MNTRLEVVAGLAIWLDDADGRARHSGSIRVGAVVKEVKRQRDRAVRRVAAMDRWLAAAKRREVY